MTDPGLWTALMLSAATGSGVYVLVLTEIFTPLRRWIAEQTRHEAWFWVKLAGISTCPYCAGTWLAMILVLVYRPVLVDVPYVRPGFSFWPLGYLVSVLFVNGTAMLWVLIIKRALGK